MDKLQELEKKYKELGEEIERLKNECKVWKPKEHEEFYTVSGYGKVGDCEFNSHNPFTKGYVEMGNCFKTKAEAEAVSEKIRIYTELKRLAEEINTEPIDWKASKQYKYNILFDEGDKKLHQNTAFECRHLGGLYSTNKNFLEIAKKRIGEGRLLKLFKED